MRHKIWQKDDFFQFTSNEELRIDMDATAVQLPEERLPLVWSFNWGDVKSHCGWVSDIKLEDGEITCEVELTTPAMTEDDFFTLGLRLGGYYTEVQKKILRPGLQEEVTKCRLKGVSIMFLNQTPGANPGARVN